SFPRSCCPARSTHPKPAPAHHAQIFQRHLSHILQTAALPPDPSAPCLGSATNANCARLDAARLAAPASGLDPTRNRTAQPPAEYDASRKSPETHRDASKIPQNPVSKVNRVGTRASCSCQSLPPSLIPDQPASDQTSPPATSPIRSKRSP